MVERGGVCTRSASARRQQRVSLKGACGLITAALISVARPSLAPGQVWTMPAAAAPFIEWQRTDGIKSPIPGGLCFLNRGTWTVFVQPPPVKLSGMKLKNVIPKRNHPEFVWRFGGAKLVKLQSGQHELIGGSEQDKADALDWISLFAPEIVFHHFHRPCRCR